MNSSLDFAPLSMRHSGLDLTRDLSFLASISPHLDCFSRRIQDGA
jgi:hypothetical protein